MNREIVSKLVNNISKVIIGKEEAVLDIVKGLLSGGHIIIEDLPGLGKTTLIKSLAKSLGLSFSRIQFTPDLLPSDITGISVYNPKTMEFEFRQGPIFSNIVLADEINRTSPKTQAALLEVMEENQVTEGNTTYKFKRPFLVLATQNPIELEGTFVLPEAQLDRFTMKISMGYPKREEEVRMMKNFMKDNPLLELSSVVSKDELLKAMDEVNEVMVHDDLLSYISNLSYESRINKDVMSGVSPRASLALMRVAKAEAYIEGRDFVIPDDIKKNTQKVFSHRIKLTNLARNRGVTAESVVKNIVASVKSPV